MFVCNKNQTKPLLEAGIRIEILFCLFIMHFIILKHYYVHGKNALVINPLKITINMNYI